MVAKKCAPHVHVWQSGSRPAWQQRCSRHHFTAVDAKGIGHHQQTCVSCGAQPASREAA